MEAALLVSLLIRGLMYVSARTSDAVIVDTAMQSRLVRNTTPTFYWSLRKDQIGDYKHLRKDVMVNHFGRAGVLTTKMGLATNLKTLPWCAASSLSSFFLLSSLSFFYFLSLFLSAFLHHSKALTELFDR